MAQKINPISFRLGVIQVWKSTLQTYGKSFKQYSKIFQKYSQIQKLLNKVFYKSDFLLNHQEWKIFNNKIHLSIFYTKLVKSKYKKMKYKKFYKTMSIILKQWFSLDIIAHLYLNLEVTKPTTTLFILYTQNLLLQNKAPKKILWNLCKILENYLNVVKISFFKSGPLKIILKGFKIRLTGRIEGSKNQMAKSIEQSVGSLTLAKINSYVEYESKDLYTKSGICGIQIWLFYEVN